MKIEKAKRLLFNPEIISIIIIAAFVILMINICDKKINQMEDSKDLCLPIDSSSTLDEDEENQIIEQLQLYNPNISKMAEVYSTDFNMITRICGKDYNISPNDIKDFEILDNILLDNDRGYCTYENGNVDQIVYFQHITVYDEDAIAIIWLPYHKVTNLWLISFIGYIILILIFTLFNLVVLKYQKTTLKTYNTIRRI
jgi:hypothetical protein